MSELIMLFCAVFLLALLLPGPFVGPVVNKGILYLLNGYAGEMKRLAVGSAFSYLVLVVVALVILPLYTVTITPDAMIIAGLSLPTLYIKQAIALLLLILGISAWRCASSTPAAPKKGAGFTFGLLMSFGHPANFGGIIAVLTSLKMSGYYGGTVVDNVVVMVSFVAGLAVMWGSVYGIIKSQRGRLDQPACLILVRKIVAVIFMASGILLAFMTLV